MVEELHQHIKCSNKIEELIISLFAHISKKNGKGIVDQYYSEAGKHSFIIKAAQEFILKLMAMSPLDPFKELTDHIINLLLNCPLAKREIFCFAILLEIDKNIPFLVEEKPYLFSGESFSYIEYLFIMNIVDPFFARSLNEMGIRRGRQTSAFQRDGINSHFSCFKVYKECYFTDYHPVVKYLLKNSMKNRYYIYNFGNELKIGMSPFSRNRWFHVIENECNHTFSISTDDVNNDHKRRIEEILQIADQQKYDVIMFPELAIDGKTSNSLKQLVLKNEFNNLKLIFFGSCWNDNENVAALYNSQGSLLLQEKKKSRFSYYDKKRDIVFSEDIKEESDIHFVDIPGLGRIVYLICADMLEEGITSTYNKLETNFVFVSALSNNTDLLVKRAKFNADDQAITTMICNACTELSEGDGNFAAYACTLSLSHKKIECCPICLEQTCATEEKCGLCIKSAYVTKKL